MKKTLFNITIIILMLATYSTTHAKLYSEILSKSAKKQHIFNGHWDNVCLEMQQSIKRKLVRQNDELEKKIKSRSSRYCFNTSYFGAGLWYLLPMTAYTSACLYGAYKVYASLTEENGTMENFVTSVLKNSAAWYGFKLFLPYAQKGYKKMRKSLYPKKHYLKKLAAVKLSLEKIRISEEEYGTAEDNYVPTLKNIVKNKETN